MTPRTLARIAIALVLVLVLWGASKLLSHKSDSVTGGWPVAGLSMGDADSVVIDRGAAGVTLLAKHQGGSWTANGWPASTEAVTEFFRAINDSSRAELVSQSQSSHERLSLDSANAMRLRVYGHGKALIDWTMGKAGTDYPSVYARRTGEVAAYMLHSDVGDLAKKSTDDWRDKKITGVPLDSITAVDIQIGSKKYGVHQISGKRWAFASGKLADSSKVMTQLAHYVNIQASGFATRAQIDSMKRLKARRHVVVKHGNATAVELSFDSAANYYLVSQPHDSVTYRMETWAVNELTPKDSALAPGSATPLPAVTPIPLPTKRPGKSPAKAPAKSATKKH